MFIADEAHGYRQDSNVFDLYKRVDAFMKKHTAPAQARARGAYFGASRIAPSSRITSPLSISLVTICCTTWSAGVPRRPRWPC